MGVLNALGYNGPFTKWLDANRGRLSGAGYGFASGKNFSEGVSNAIKSGYKGMERDELWADEQEKVQQQNQTISWLEQQAAVDPRFAQLAEAVKSGGMDVGSAWQTGIQWLNAKPDPVKGIEINGRLVNPLTGEEMGNFSDPAEPQQPWSVSPGETLIDPTTREPIYSAPSNNTGRQTDAQRRATNLNSVVQDEATLLLGDGTPQNPGIFDATRDSWDQILDSDLPGVGRIGRGLTEPDYQRAAAAIESIAQHYLYVQSGQAAPEGEVKRLAASVTPFPGEAKASIDEKRRRLQTWVQAVETAAGNAQDPAMPSDGAVPPGIDPGLWQYMTPEERMLFQ